MPVNAVEFTAAWFDESSAIWRENKIKSKTGGFRYKKKARWWVGCGFVHSSRGQQCCRKTEAEAREDRTCMMVEHAWTSVATKPSTLFCHQHVRRGTIRIRAEQEERDHVLDSVAIAAPSIAPI